MILERGLKLALAETDEALRELATAARWVDRSAFEEGASFAQAHQALLKALEKAGRCLRCLERKLRGLTNILTTWKQVRHNLFLPTPQTAVR